jgi:hypothetical protein
MKNCSTLGNICCNELEKTLSSAGAKAQSKFFADGGLEGIMCWILSETHVYKDVLSTREDYCAWIGTRSTTSVLLKAGCNHVRTCMEPNFKVSTDNVQRSIVEASEWSKKLLSDIWTKGGKKINIEESMKNKEKVRN